MGGAFRSSVADGSSPSTRSVYELERVGNLDQVVIGIADVDRPYGPRRSGAVDDAFLDGDLAHLHMIAHLLQGRAGDQADVRTAGCGSKGLWFELFAVLVQVDLLLPKGKRLAIA